MDISLVPHDIIGRVFRVGAALGHNVGMDIGPALSVSLGPPDGIQYGPVECTQDWIDVSVDEENPTG